MCFSGYPSHYVFQYFFDAKEISIEAEVDEIRLAEDYQKDMELAENIFRKLVSSDSSNDERG